MDKTYRIIPATQPPGDPMWQIVYGEADSMNVEDISRHATRQEAEAVKAALERRDAGAP